MSRNKETLKNKIRKRVRQYNKTVKFLLENDVKDARNLIEKCELNEQIVLRIFDRVLPIFIKGITWGRVRKYTMNESELEIDLLVGKDKLK